MVSSISGVSQFNNQSNQKPYILKSWYNNSKVYLFIQNNPESFDINSYSSAAVGLQNKLVNSKTLDQIENVIFY